MKSHNSKEVIPQMAGLVGGVHKFGGPLFSRIELPVAEYRVLKWRWTQGGWIMDTKTMRYLHPTLELLLKSDKMHKALWGGPFVAYDIVPGPDLELRYKDEVILTDPGDEVEPVKMILK